MRRQIFIFLLFAMALEVSAKEISNVPCGTWIEISASPLTGFHFVRWNDDNTDSTRQVEVNEDMQFIAYFNANCDNYANFPIVMRYDWVIMLDVRAIREMGYFFNDADIVWYQVMNEVDNILDDSWEKDDIKVGNGPYLTIDQRFSGTGDYYAVVDVSNNTGQLCEGLMRSQIAHCSSASKVAPAVKLSPTFATPMQPLTISGLMPDEETTILIFDMLGKLVRSITVQGECSYILTAEKSSGCYNVAVRSASIKTALRYLIAEN